MFFKIREVRVFMLTAANRLSVETSMSVPNSIPHRFQEKGNLEVLLFTIQSRMRANNQKVYTPHDGKLVSDINRVLGQWQLPI